MYKIPILIALKDGKTISGIYETDKTSSLDVAKEMIPEKYEGNSHIKAIMSEDGKEQIFFRSEDISMMKIISY